MAYTSPPTFVSGAVLTAAQLNILSDDVEYINSVTDYINLPFSTYQYGRTGEENMENAFWMIRHRHRYLHYYLTVDTGTITNDPHTLHLEINWAGTWRVVLSPGIVIAAPATYASYIDLQGTDTSSVALSIPIGDFMRVHWSANCAGLATAWYFAESSFVAL